MVGIVIVSHSAMLAEGVKELTTQMVKGLVPLATAGGIDDLENPIGTDPMKVLAAIESVLGTDGVLVMMDLGSALLSAEMAIEFLPAAQQGLVRLCDGPLVEGTMAAAVQAMVGGSLDTVLAEARGALTAKIEQLGGEEEDGVGETAVSPPSTAAETKTITIQNLNGLHARPAAQFVKGANQFGAEIQAQFKGRSVNAKSYVQVSSLGVPQGAEILLTAVGADAATALDTLGTMAADLFGERHQEQDELAEAVPDVVDADTPTVPGVMKGLAASPGIAIGPVYQYRPSLPQIEQTEVDDAEAEWDRLQTAVDVAIKDILAVHALALNQVGQAEAAIFDAHLLFLQDPNLLQSAKTAVLQHKQNAAYAWQQLMDDTAANFRAMPTSYMQARAADVADVGNRVLRNLLHLALPKITLSEPSILVATDLAPSDTAQLDPALVLGICIEVGGVTSHSAILARAVGIPAIVGAGAALSELADGQQIALDGSTGFIWTAPSAADLAALSKARDEWVAAQEAARKSSQAPAVTVDGHRIEVAANIGGVKDTAVAIEYGAEGVGLFRTEFLFLDRENAPSEEEQLQAYRAVVQVMGQQPVIIRTLDVGGDKPLPYLDLGQEDNPFLGWRGIRFCLDKPEIFKPQLRAILRATVDDQGQPNQVKMMFPMIGSLPELLRAKALLAEVKTELRAAGIKFNDALEVGVMIEVPSAVVMADLLAREVDFFSIGTNDLTQYVMAADRGNANVSELAQALQPAVLRMIQQTVDAAHAAGIWVGMCGELAGNALVTPVLLGMGLDELSMSAPSIAGVKTAVRHWTLAAAKQAAHTVGTLATTSAVIAYLESIQKSE